jgi:hypothetical protein
MGQLRKLEQKRNLSTSEIYERLRSRTWRADDLREVIKIGLEGGGLNVNQADELLLEYFDPFPKLPFVVVALRILEAAFVGPQDDEIPKGEAAEEKSEPASSLSPLSTPGVRSLDITRERSINSRSGNSAPFKPDGSPLTA